MNRREFLQYSACLGAGGAAARDRSFLEAAASEPTPGRRYYASPSGGGNGQSAASPFQIEDFWAVDRQAALALADEPADHRCDAARRVPGSARCDEDRLRAGRRQDA